MKSRFFLLVAGSACLAFLSAGADLAAQESRVTPGAPATRRTPTVQKCSSIIVGKDATADGSVILAHNEDLANYCAHHFVFVPRVTNAPGATFAAYFGTNVPQPAVTYAYTATKIFRKSYVPGDITSGINEHQVAVVNNMSYRRDVPEELATTNRLIWTEFTQLALERSTSAREAVRVIGDLAHAYKLGADSGTMYGVADTNEGWWVEVTYDGQWVAQRVPSNAVSVRANIFRIDVVDFNDPTNFMFSADLVDYAKSNNWYSDTNAPFRFATVYAEPSKLDDPYNTRRVWRANYLLDPRIAGIEPQHVIAVLRDHYEGTTYDLTGCYTNGSPHQTDERTLCSINSEVSVVCQLRGWLPVEIGALCWRAMATPCTSIFSPWYFGSQQIPTPYATGSNVFTKKSAYWTFRMVSRYADVRYLVATGRIRKKFNEFEQKEFAAQAEVEQTAGVLYLQDRSRATDYLTKYSTKMAKRAMTTANAFAK